MPRPVGNPLQGCRLAVHRRAQTGALNPALPLLCWDPNQIPPSCCGTAIVIRAAVCLLACVLLDCYPCRWDCSRDVKLTRQSGMQTPSAGRQSAAAGHPSTSLPHSESGTAMAAAAAGAIMMSSRGSPRTDLLGRSPSAGRRSMSGRMVDTTPAGSSSASVRTSGLVR